MKLDPSKNYRMPLLMGPLLERKAMRLPYPHVETLAFQYLTDAEALEALLPECYRPGKEPFVTVIFSQSSGLAFMAGGGYRMAAFMVEARFDGEQDHVNGELILVMFENQTWPIIGGREDLGVPTLYADIPPIKHTNDGHLRCEASYWGHMLFGLDLPPMGAQNVIVKTMTTRQINARPWLAYKYIPALDGPPDADYPTITRNEVKLDRLWTGKKATLRFGTARAEDIGAVKTLLDALATLTILKPVAAMHFTGSSVLRYDLSRRLR